ncbi:MAG: ABC transporter substrate binding protein [Sedimenticola sp.]
MSWDKNYPSRTQRLIATMPLLARGWSYVLLLVFSLSTATATHSDTDVLIVSSADSPVYQSVISSLRTHLASLCTGNEINCTLPKIKEAKLSNWSESIIGMHPNGVIITLGREAAKQVALSKKKNPHVINALIPKAAVDQLNLNRSANRNTAIYLDQPIRRQLHLAAIANPGDRVGILLGPTTQQLKPLIAQEAIRLGIKINYQNILKGETIGPLLKDLLGGSDILLALPDPLIYSRKNIFNILLSSYHSKVPVIGFSATYVKAGAIAAVYSSPEDIGHHLADTINTMYQEGIEPTLHSHLSEHPKYFSVDVNKRVSRSLGINLPSNKEIIKILSVKGEIK